MLRAGKERLVRKTLWAAEGLRLEAGEDQSPGLRQLRPDGRRHVVAFRQPNDGCH